MNKRLPTRVLAARRRRPAKAEVIVRWVCPLCGGEHSRADCPDSIWCKRV